MAQLGRVCGVALWVAWYGRGGLCAVRGGAAGWWGQAEGLHGRGVLILVPVVWGAGVLVFGGTCAGGVSVSAGPPCWPVCHV